MTDTNKLTSTVLTDLSGSDQLRLWSQKYGGDVAITLTILKAWLDANDTSQALTAQYEAPTATGFSATITAVNTWLILTPSAGYAAGTIVLPTGTHGAEILVNCTQAVTALTVTPASGDSVVGAPTALTANQSFRLKYDGVLDRWYNVGN
ncbi:MAG: hypothetical protein EP341_00845 [Sphingomonadales bacterium]|nr:MAG: hypothetical protein EP341_00845 [Sphingomonadales bacterium]